MTPQDKALVIRSIAAVSFAFWLLAAAGTVLLLKEVNRQPRPKRLALLAALTVNDVTPRGKTWQRRTTAGIVGFLVCLAALILSFSIPTG